MASSSRFALPFVAATALLASASAADAAPPAAQPRSPAKTQSQSASASKPRVDSSTRRAIAGGPTLDDTSAGADTPELRALYAAEKELFPPASPAPGAKWPDELPFPLGADADHPHVHASGLPPAPPTTRPPETDAGKDLAWLAKLDLPDIPVRWDPRVVRYLEFWRDDARGRSLMATWIRRSGRYIGAIKRALKQKGMPEDLAWLAMIESGFEPIARSPVGAMGLWQFMPETGKIYGLTQDRWADRRLSLAASTEAACDFLEDLHRRFGSWDLAMAAYNMGYGGILQAVRRYNTNDYWALAKLEGSLPWETTLYVPKILSAAIVVHNLEAFGLKDVTPDPPLDGEEVPVAPGTSLATVAQACGTTTKDLADRNPELRAQRTPPAQEEWPVKVPLGKAAGCAQNLVKTKKVDAPVEKYVVRFGESLDQIAQARRVSVNRLVEMNAIAPGEVLRGGTVLLVPKVDDSKRTAPSQETSKKAADKPVVVVPQELFVYPDRKRVFYKVTIGDTLKDVAQALKVTVDELRRWNDVDPSARLVENMTLQAFVPRSLDLSKVVTLSDADVRTVVVGTDEFFQYWDEKGRRRVVVTAKAGDTLDSIGKKHGISGAMMERINRRGKSEALAEGEQVVLWLPGTSASRDATASLHGVEPARDPFAVPAPAATPPLGAPPAEDRLPRLP